MRNRPQVTVLGSLNMDISVTVPRLPEPGATVLGSAARFTPGGKGANQAVAAARLGAGVRMAGCVGDDDFGRRLLAALRDEGVGHDGIRVTADAPTGLAMISVDHAGENIITVAPGANHEVGPAEVRAALAEPQTVLVVCAEIPVGVIVAALARHRTSILNLAPAPEPPADAAAIVAGARPDWLVVNETEAGAVLGRPVRGLAEAAQAAAALLTAGARHAVVTAGAHGAALAGPDGTGTVSAFRVDWPRASRRPKRSAWPRPRPPPPPPDPVPRPACRARRTSSPPPESAGRPGNDSLKTHKERYTDVLGGGR